MLRNPSALRVALLLDIVEEIVNDRNDIEHQAPDGTGVVLVGQGAEQPVDSSAKVTELDHNSKTLVGGVSEAAMTGDEE